MAALFYVSSVLAVLSTVIAVSSLNAFHALLFLVGSLLSIAAAFVILGAPFVAVVEVVIYAGAIVVLLVFAVMMLNVGELSLRRERSWASGRAKAAAAVLALLLIAEISYLTLVGGQRPATATSVGPKAVAVSLFGPYMLGVELVSMLLLGALVAAFHLGWRRKDEEVSNGTDTIRAWPHPGGASVLNRSDGPSIST